MARLDHQFRPTDLVTARYYINDSSTNNTGTYGIPASDPTADITDVRVQSMLGAHTHIFSPTLVNELRFTYLRRKFIDSRPGYGENLAAEDRPQGRQRRRLPGLHHSRATPRSAIPPRSPASRRRSSTARFWIRSPGIRGKHALKFGVEYRAGANDEIRDRGSAGNFAISPLITDLPGVSGTGNALASFLLGEVNSASIQVSDKIPSRASYWRFYVQDDWRVTDRLTINAGLRWEAELPRRVVGNKMNSFDPLAINPVSGTPGVVTFAGRQRHARARLRDRLEQLRTRAWASPTALPGKHETVIRGGGGIFYGPTVSNTIGDVASLGFSTSASYVVAAGRVPERAPAARRLPRRCAPAARRRPSAPCRSGRRPTPSVGFFNPEQVAPISYQYNLSVQREVAQRPARRSRLHRPTSATI